MYELIREAFANHRSEYNFLQGDEAYKSVWTQDHRTLSNVYIYNKSLLGRAARTGYRWKETVKRGPSGRHAVRARPDHVTAPDAALNASPAVEGDRKVRYAVEVAGIEVLRSSKAEWNALVASMRYATVFCNWEWICTWWEHFGTGRDLRVLMIRRNGRLKGVLPLFSEWRFFGRDGRVGRALGYCGATDLHPDPLDIISAPADAGECFDAALDYLWNSAKDWDVLHFRFLTEDSDLLRGLTGASRGDVAAKTISKAPYILITGTYENYLRGLSGNERSKIGRCRRKLMDGQGAIYTDLASEDKQRILQILLDLHRKRAAEKKIQSSFARTDVIAFHRDLLNRMDPSQVWLRGLRRGDEVIAVFYGYALGGRVFYYQLGHSPEWGAFSPGTVLLHETIREAFERGYTEYNLLQGEEDYKYRWTGQIRQLYAVDMFNRSLCGRLSRRAIGAKRWLKSGVSLLVGR
jgi:CelD/BcsL family acetyltransferase involved in cellulose biosynthesis